MIVLDVTVVNVALPSIQDDLGFSQSNLAWVVNAYLIAFGGLLLLAGRFGDLIGRRRIFLAGLAVFTAASLLCALSQSQEMLVGARFVQGDRRRADLGGDPRHDRDDVPRAARAGEGDRRLRASSPSPAARSGCWSAACSPRRSAGTGSSSSTCRSGSRPRCWRCALVHDRDGIGSSEGADLPGAVADHRSLMLGVYTIVEPTRGRLGRDARRSRSARSRSALLAAFVAREATDRQPADAAADLPLAQRHRREPGPGADRRGDVRDVLPRRALPAADPRLRRAPDRPRLPAGDDRDGHAVGPLLRAADHALRRARRCSPGSPGRRSGCCCSRARRSTATTRSTSCRRCRCSGSASGSLPVADDAGDVGRHPRATPDSPRAWSTPAPRSAARSASRCWRRCPAERTDGLIADGVDGLEALNSGYHLAYLVGAALVVAAIVVAIRVLEPEEKAVREAARADGRGGEPAYSEAG